MKKEGGLRGYNPTTSKKSHSSSFSYAFYHFHEGSPKAVMVKMPRILAGDGRNADKHLT